jgi:predicted NBD/HSP70 family sugar kinase
MRLGIDVGGTKTDAVIVDERGEVANRVRIPTGWGPDGVIATVEEVVRHLSDHEGMRAADFLSAGIGIPGLVPTGTTRITQAMNLGIDDFDLGAEIEKRIGVPVNIDNDVNAAALGAHHLLGLSGSMAYLNLGTGVAAGLVNNGELWRGSHGAAGEIGHVSIDPNGPSCRCGQRGCVEALAGGASLAARWGGAAKYPIVELMDAARTGDSRALELQTGLARGVAAAVQILVLSTDVETVVLGGGVSSIGQPIVDLVSVAVEEVSRSSSFVRSLKLTARLRMLPPGSPAAALGAAMLGREVVRS